MSTDYTSDDSEITRGSRWPEAEGVLTVTLTNDNSWPTDANTWTWSLLFSRLGVVGMTLSAESATLTTTKVLVLTFYATPSQTQLIPGAGRQLFKVELKSIDLSGTVSYYDSVEGTAVVRDFAEETDTTSPLPGSTAAGRITSRKELKTYILETLGFPTINVELTDAQLNHAINDALRWYKEFADVPNQRDFLVIHTVAGQADYDVPDTMKAFLGVINARTSGINNLFTIENILYSSGQLYFQNFDLVSYYLAMSFIKTLDYVLGTNIFIRFSDAENKVTVFPTPTSAGTLMLEIYNVIDSTEYYDNTFVKDYSRAAAKFIWGMVGSKYSIELPQGGTINLRELKSEAKEEMADAIKLLRDSYAAPPRFFRG